MDLNKYNYILNNADLSEKEKRINLVKMALKDFKLEDIEKEVLISYLIEMICEYSDLIPVNEEHVNSFNDSEDEEFEINNEDKSQPINAYDIFHDLRLLVINNLEKETDKI